MTDTSSPPALLAVDHIHVYVADRAAAERWYRDVLGLTREPSLAFWADDGGFLAWRGHLERVLARTLQAVDHTASWSLYFEDPDGNPYEITTYDYAAVHERLQGAAA